MIYISNLEKVTESKYSIGYVHFQPFDTVYGLDKTEEELLQTGKLVEAIEAENKEGFNSVMYYNPIEDKLFYEHQEIDKIQEQPLLDRVAALEIALASVMGV